MQDQITASILHRGKKLNKHNHICPSWGHSTLLSIVSVNVGAATRSLLSGQLTEFDWLTEFDRLTDNPIVGSPILHTYPLLSHFSQLNPIFHLNSPSFDIIVEAWSPVYSFVFVAMMSDQLGHGCVTSLVTVWRGKSWHRRWPGLNCWTLSCPASWSSSVSVSCGDESWNSCWKMMNTFLW